MLSSPLWIKNTRLRIALLLLGLGMSSFLTWQHYYPVQAEDGWSFKVFLDDIPKVSAMVVDRQGNLYVSQEFNTQKGGVFRLQADGTRKNIMTRLSKPDGLVLFQDGVAASQEGGKHHILWWREGKIERLFEGNSIEGLASDGRHLFAVEDVKRDGRLLKYDPETKETTTLRDGLDEPEGITICPDGNLFYTEKKKGWIKRFRPGGSDEIAVRGLHAPSFLMCNNEGLWITEDLTHGARLLRLDASGATHIILKHLRSAQTIISIAPGHFLVAEQGRGRILELNRLANAKH